MNYLIVNADDFGYSPGVNRGIVEAHINGVVTSTSVMVDAVAAQEAYQLVDYPELSIGLHMVINPSANLETELKRQVQKFISIVGAKPDHIDVHKLIEPNETIEDFLRVYSEQNKVPVRRVSGIKFIDSFFGYKANDGVSVVHFKNAVNEATEKYNEIMCHVGYSDDYLRKHSSYNDMRERELRTVCDPEVKQYVEEKGLKLINWHSVKLQF